MSPTDPLRGTEPTPGDRIAAALRKDPIYVDPSLAQALPPDKRAGLRAAIRRCPSPTYVLLVPLVAGSQWSHAQQLATVVQAALGSDGIFLTLNEETTDDVRAFTWKNGTLDLWGDNAYAASAVYFQDDMTGKPIADRLIRAATLIAQGNGTALYKRLTARYNSPAPKPGKSGGTSWLLPAGGAATAVVALGAGLLLWRQKREAAVRRSEIAAVRPLRQLLATAQQASEDELRKHAQSEVVAFGELLEHTDVRGDDRVQELMSRALDAYQAAAKTLDSAEGVPDLAGVLVLADQGRDALTAAQEVAAGRPEPASTPLCFFNPLHGDAQRRITWRPVGTRRQLRIHACADCIAATDKRETPDCLMDGDTAYFDVDPGRSVWSQTGYGQFRDDLVQRILRGDLRHEA